MICNAPIKRLEHGGLTVEGYSRAAVQTYWRVPELKLPPGGYARLYIEHVQQADQGAGDHRRGVEEGPLGRPADRRRLVERGDRYHLAPGDEAPHRSREKGPPFAQIGAQPERRPGHAQAPAACGMMARASGPRGRRRISWMRAVALIGSPRRPEYTR